MFGWYMALLFFLQTIDAHEPSRAELFFVFKSAPSRAVSTSKVRAEGARSARLSSGAEYDKNFQLSEKILKSTKPQGGFFNFIPVKNDLLATKHLWENHGVKVMPGSFMAFENNNDNPGKNYLRIALLCKIRYHL